MRHLRCQHHQTLATILTANPSASGPGNAQALDTEVANIIDVSLGNMTQFETSTTEEEDSNQEPEVLLTLIIIKP